ncbi:probable transcription factor KAN2 isoform X2 [Impatiens glandulifera]|uniref:probable transcription factor KAN2 isoform X2 n=1 Tax=Impatiens glandulifera TaxID=253017 RepID=UPI001FB124C8|nr:probable transcription factor KAN2 isoform X2 [Impatiens glandulifera]
MELFPDLSLQQISPPPITMNDNKEYYYHSIWNKSSSLSINSIASSSTSLETPSTPQLRPILIHNQKHLKPPTEYHIDIGLMKMMMMPPQDSYSSSSSSSSSPPEYNCLQFSHHERRRPMTAAAAARFPTKRTRAPRMRWTTSLHARFLHALHLLGGHHRATPKSVLELMEVKDLTLAHVKSHLQMYRTVKTSDRSTMVSSGGFENNRWMSGETSEDMTTRTTTMVMFDDSQTIIRSDSPPLLWSNTSSSNNGHGNWVHGKTIMDNNNSRRNMISSSSSSLDHHHHEEKYCLSSGKVNCSSKPNLDFTLGTPLH